MKPKPVSAPSAREASIGLPGVICAPKNFVLLAPAKKPAAQAAAADAKKTSENKPAQKKADKDSSSSEDYEDTSTAARLMKLKRAVDSVKLDDEVL